MNIVFSSMHFSHLGLVAMHLPDVTLLVTYPASTRAWQKHADMLGDSIVQHIRFVSMTVIADTRRGCYFQVSTYQISI